MTDRWFARVFLKWTSLAGGPWLLAEPHGGDGNDGCVRCSGTNVRPSRWPLPSVSTTAHSARRRQGSGEEYETHYTAKFRKHSSPTSPAHSTLRLTTTTVVPELGSWPDRLYEVRPQERVLRHIVEQTGDVAPGLPALDAPVPQMVDQLEDVLQIVDLFVLSRRAKCPRSPANTVLLLVGFFLCRRRQNSWWTCHYQSGCGLHSAPTPLAGCGPACGCHPRGSTGSWRAPGIPRGPARQGSRPAQGGI